MRYQWLLCAIALAVSLPAAAEQPSGECKESFALHSLDQDVVKLLSTPVVPPNPGMAANASLEQLVEWDLPSRVTAWQQRPSAEELAKQWDELAKQWNPVRQSKDNSRTAAPSTQYRPYSAQPFPGNQWKDLEKWLAKEGPKKLPGLCIEPDKAAYILAVGIVSGGSAAGSRSGGSNPYEYAQLPTASQQNSASGPNAATYSPTAHQPGYDELSGMGAGTRDLSAHTCAYLFRANGPGGARLPTPDYYYCQSSADVPRSVLTTMLKYLAKTGLP